MNIHHVTNIQRVCLHVVMYTCTSHHVSSVTLFCRSSEAPDLTSSATTSVLPSLAAIIIAESPSYTITDTCTVEHTKCYNNVHDSAVSEIILSTANCLTVRTDTSTQRHVVMYMCSKDSLLTNLLSESQYSRGNETTTNILF